MTRPCEPSHHTGRTVAGNPSWAGAGCLSEMRFAEIAARRGGWGRLAYLSACETTRTPPDLADESIHLTSAFLSSGSPG